MAAGANRTAARIAQLTPTAGEFIPAGVERDITPDVKSTIAGVRVARATRSGMADDATLRVQLDGQLAAVAGPSLVTGGAVDMTAPLMSIENAHNVMTDTLTQLLGRISAISAARPDDKSLQTSLHDHDVFVDRMASLSSSELRSTLASLLEAMKAASQVQASTNPITDSELLAGYGRAIPAAGEGQQQLMLQQLASLTEAVVPAAPALSDLRKLARQQTALSAQHVQQLTAITQQLAVEAKADQPMRTDMGRVADAVDAVNNRDAQTAEAEADERDVQQAKSRREEAAAKREKQKQAKKESDAKGRFGSDEDGEKKTSFMTKLLTGDFKGMRGDVIGAAMSTVGLEDFSEEMDDYIKSRAEKDEGAAAKDKEQGEGSGAQESTQNPAPVSRRSAADVAPGLPAPTDMAPNTQSTALALPQPSSLSSNAALPTVTGPMNGPEKPFDLYSPRAHSVQGEHLPVDARTSSGIGGRAGNVTLTADKVMLNGNVTVPGGQGAEQVAGGRVSGGQSMMLAAPTGRRTIGGVEQLPPRRGGPARRMGKVGPMPRMPRPTGDRMRDKVNRIEFFVIQQERKVLRRLMKTLERVEKALPNNGLLSNLFGRTKLGRLLGHGGGLDDFGGWGSDRGRGRDNHRPGTRGGRLRQAMSTITGGLRGAVAGAWTATKGAASRVAGGLGDMLPGGRGGRTGGGTRGRLGSLMDRGRDFVGNTRNRLGSLASRGADTLRATGGKLMGAASLNTAGMLERASDLKDSAGDLFSRGRNTAGDALSRGKDFAGSATRRARGLMPSGGRMAGRSGGLLSRAGGLASRVAGSTPGILGKAGGAVGSVLSKGALGAAKFIPFAGQALAAGMAIADGVAGWNRAGENFGLGEGQEASTGQKLSSALGGIASGLSFGLLDEGSAARGLHSLGSSVGSFFGFGDDEEEASPKASDKISAPKSFAETANGQLLQDLGEPVVGSKLASNAVMSGIGLAADDAAKAAAVTSLAATAASRVGDPITLKTLADPKFDAGKRIAEQQSEKMKLLKDWGYDPDVAKRLGLGTAAVTAAKAGTDSEANKPLLDGIGGAVTGADLTSAAPITGLVSGGDQADGGTGIGAVVTKGTLDSSAGIGGSVLTAESKAPSLLDRLKQAAAYTPIGMAAKGFSSLMGSDAVGSIGSVLGKAAALTPLGFAANGISKLFGGDAQAETAGDTASGKISSAVSSLSGLLLPGNGATAAMSPTTSMEQRLGDLGLSNGTASDKVAKATFIPANTGSGSAMLASGRTMAAGGTLSARGPVWDSLMSTADSMVSNLFGTPSVSSKPLVTGTLNAAAHLPSAIQDQVLQNDTLLSKAVQSQQAARGAVGSNPLTARPGEKVSTRTQPRAVPRRGGSASGSAGRAGGASSFHVDDYGIAVMNSILFD